MNKPESTIDKFSAKLSKFTPRDLRLIFWFTSILRIPLIAALLAAPITLIIWAVNITCLWKNPNPNHIETVIFSSSFGFSILAEMKLWKSYKVKYMNKNE